MALDILFLKALDDTVKEIQGYSKEVLDEKLRDSKVSDFALTIESLIDFKTELEITFYIQDRLTTKSVNLSSLIDDTFVESIDFSYFSYLSFDKASNDEYYLLAA